MGSVNSLKFRKKTNPAGEELIFEPRLIQMPKGEKVIDLKGKG